MRQLLTVLILLLAAVSTVGQNQSLHFISMNDARFFVYVNGKLQNERAAGMYTVNGLEDKEYHIRIVIDDPFTIAVTKTIRPDAKHREWTVEFNAVKERVYLREAKAEKEEANDDNEGRSRVRDDGKDKGSPVSSKASRTQTNTTKLAGSNGGQNINQLKTKTVMEDK
ncbi:MAG: hypothetical protein K5864_05805 [Bacteroidales bacterium]|nr:hypothetical protein [Bacteroidales bacterium]